MNGSEAVLRLAGVEEDSIVDGPGLRMTVFTQGCPHHCEGCHNPQTWPIEGGEYQVEALIERLSANPLCSGLTLSGGEPLQQTAACAALAAGAKALGRSVWLYSGYTFEQMQVMMEHDAPLRALLAAVDVLVDGPFLLAERDLTLPYRGSRNQRLIDVPRSLQRGEVQLWESPIRPPS